MATLREQAKTSIPQVTRVLKNSFNHGRNALEAEREQFEFDQQNAVTKALSIIECPVKVTTTHGTTYALMHYEFLCREHKQQPNKYQ